MNTENPTPETDAATESARYFKEESQGELSELCMVVSADFACTLERQRDAARAEAKEAKKRLAYVYAMGLRFGMMKTSDKPEPYLAHTWTEDSAHERMFREWSESIGLCAEAARLTKEHQAAIDTGVYSNDPQLRTEVAQRRKAMADIVRELGHGCCGLSHEEIAPEVKKVMAELATLRAQSQDHGAAIEAAAKALLLDLYHDGQLRIVDQGDRIRIERNITKHLRALVVAVTTSQQKGGEEPCKTQPAHQDSAQSAAIPTAQSTGEKIVSSNAAPTSDPEGAANIWRRDGYHGDNFLATNQAQEIALALYPKREDERQYPLFLACRERAERTVEPILTRLRAQHAEELRRHKAALKVARDGLKVYARMGYPRAQNALAAIDKELKP